MLTTNITVPSHMAYTSKFTLTTSVLDDALNGSMGTVFAGNAPVPLKSQLGPTWGPGTKETPLLPW